jgi:hypothetical protein
VPDTDEYCKRLKIVVDASNGEFQSLIATQIGSPAQYTPKVQLPNTRECSLGAAPDVEKDKGPLYYNCSVFFNEKSESKANEQFEAYVNITYQCLGIEWKRDDRAMLQQVKKHTSFQSKLGKVELLMYEDKDGLNMGISVR